MPLLSSMRARSKKRENYWLNKHVSESARSKKIVDIFVNSQPAYLPLLIKLHAAFFRFYLQGVDSKVKKLFVLGVVGALIGSGSAFADTQEEVNKQISKLIGDAVSSRVSTSAAGVAAPLPNNVWGTYSNLGINADGMGIHSDIAVVGYDREINSNITVGAAFSASRTAKFNADGWSIAPYLAYRFNGPLFAVVRANYSDGTSSDSGTHTHFTGDGLAASLNGVHTFDKVYLQWRGEIAGVESKASSAGTSTHSSSTLYTADGEVGHRYDNGLKIFAGLQLGTSNQPDSYAAYARIGLEKALGKEGSINAKYETKVDDNLPHGTNFRVDTISVGAQLRF